jgi:carboxylesterase type B
MALTIFGICLVASLSRLTIAQDGPLVRTNEGTYIGKYLPSYKQDAFLGIPFAQPPVGDLRFRRPLPLNVSWTGPRDAKEYGCTCYQSSNRTDMSEDCLFLNGKFEVY